MITENYIIAATPQEMLYSRHYMSCEDIVNLLDHHDIPENKRAFLYNTYNDEAANCSGGYHFLRIVAHIDFAIKYSIFQKKWQIDLHYSALSIEEENFLRKSSQQKSQRIPSEEMAFRNYLVMSRKDVVA